jgi:hypothetical protein
MLFIPKLAPSLREGTGPKAIIACLPIYLTDSFSGQEVPFVDSTAASLYHEYEGNGEENQGL